LRRKLLSKEIDWDKAETIEIPPEPERDDLVDPHEGFLPPDEAWDIDTVDYQNCPDYDPNQDSWCVLEAPSESSEQHYIDADPNLYDGDIPPEGIQHKTAMEIESRL